MEKQKSQSWEKYSEDHGKDHFDSDNRIEGFPFNEGFPIGGPYGNLNKSYELILVDGETCRANVDYSTQYRAEGLQWRLSEASQTFEQGVALSKFIVAAWQEE